MNVIAVGLLGNEMVGALGSPKVFEMGLRGRNASLLLCVAAFCWLPVVGEERVSCHFENVGKVPLLVGKACVKAQRKP